MPTFSAIQLDRLLEPGATNNTTALKEKKVPDASRRSDIPPPHPQYLRRRNSLSSDTTFNNNNNNVNINTNNTNNSNKVTVRPQISPSLYTTPEPTPLPDSPTSSFPPSSPFLINHKRRGPRLLKSLSDQNVAAKDAEISRTRSLSEENVKVDVKAEEGGAGEGTGEGGGDGVVLNCDVVNKEAVREEKAKAKAKDVAVAVSSSETEDFYDPQESMSFSSSADFEENGAERSARASTPMGEFYDAWDELSSDSGRQAAQRSLCDVETELREMRLTLLMEIEKRRHVEEALNSMRGHWEMLREKLGLVGVALPTDLALLANEGLSEVSPTEDICRQVHLARFVSESIGRGIAKAEAEAEMEAQLEMKNFEIARLCDRLHYYESVNREMSQRNQEAVEIARHERQKRRRRQKWVWGSIATAITLGSAALAWSYLPGGKGSSSNKYLEAPEPDRNSGVVQ